MTAALTAALKAVCAFDTVHKKTETNQSTHNFSREKVLDQTFFFNIATVFIYFDVSIHGYI